MVPKRLLQKNKWDKSSKSLHDYKVWRDTDIRLSEPIWLSSFNSLHM